jgi:hypothetical protein
MHGRHDGNHLIHADGEGLHSPKPGHNRREDGGVAQWQTPHTKESSHTARENPDPDIDLVELAFVRALAAAPDPTSFLRVAQIPFEARTSNGTRLVLLRIETESITDVGSVMPHLGGGSFSYHPLPGRMASRRERLRFVYFDGREPQALTLAVVRGLRPIQSDEG